MLQSLQKVSAGSKGGFGDLAFAGLVVAIIGLLLIPLPPPLLDVLLTANVSLGVVLLLSALYVSNPLKLSTFPSLLLVATLFRLALNVSSTRLILGNGYAGEVIESFGQFVVQGNYVVGAVIFLVLTVIQFLVIAKGSERVAEVAARFTLDAMPGKQMSIDADMRAGAYTLDEARRRRNELHRESQFFGAMDGAMKFVKGDAIAGMIITLINIAGGLLIGMTQLGMSASDAASTYTLLTIGDGLVSQIPALLISVCSGILVTRVGSGDTETTDLGTEIVSQLAQSPRVFAIASGLLVIFALVPGLPFVPFVVLAACSAACSIVIQQRIREEERRLREEQAMDTSPRRREEPAMVPAVTPITVDLSPSVSSRVLAEGGEEALRDEVQRAREAFFQNFGVRLPQLKLRFSSGLVEGDDVLVRIYESHRHVIALDSTHRVSLSPAADLGALAEHARTWVHPLNSRPLLEVSEEHIGEHQYTHVRWMRYSQRLLVEVMATARRYASSFVGLAEVQHALDQLEPSHGALIDAVIPRPVPLAALTGVLRRLVEEGVSIRDLRGVLEALAEDATEEHDRIELLEIARCGIARSIWSAHARAGVVQGVITGPSIENMVRSGIRREGPAPTLALPPALTDEIFAAFEEPLQMTQVVLCAQDVRRFLRQLLMTRCPGVVVLGHGEMLDGIEFYALASIEPGGMQPIRRAPGVEQQAAVGSEGTSAAKA
jgi:type III secretion protein V